MLRQGVVVPAHKVGQFSFEGFHIGTFFQYDIGIIVGPAPGGLGVVFRGWVGANIVTKGGIGDQDVDDKMRIGGQALEYPGHFERLPVAIILINKGFADGVFIAEIFTGCRFRQDDFVGTLQGGSLIAFYQWHVEDIQGRVVRYVGFVFVESGVIEGVDELEALLPEAAEIFDLGELFFQGRAHCRGGRGPSRFQASALVVRFLHAVGAAGIWVEALVAPLVGDVFKDQQTAGDADRQPEEVEDGIAFSLGEIADGDLKEAFEHIYKGTRI